MLNLTYVGNCQNLFDENGDCLTNHFVDVNDMANDIEHSSNVDVSILPLHIFNILPPATYEFSMIGTIVFAYDAESDIDYVFEVLSDC